MTKMLIRVETIPHRINILFVYTVLLRGLSLPGTPNRRKEREADAIKRLEKRAQAEVGDSVHQEKTRQKYTAALAQQIVDLLAAGVPIDDAQLNGAVVAPGIASRLGIHRSTIYDWQQKYPEFERAVSQARTESAHRLADKMLSLADVALAEPAMANSVRVAADILRWQAGVRHRAFYGDKAEISVSASYVDVLRKVAMATTTDDGSAIGA